MKTNFYNKNGELSIYSLNCGYVESKRTEKKAVKLFKEHGVFHVKTYDEDLNINKWEAFDKLTDARKMFRNELKTN